jgi:hypothetical protein
MAGGRPTKYRKEYCDQLVKFFSKKPYRKYKVLTTDRRSGREYIDEETRAVEFPTLEIFAHKIGVNTDTIVQWASLVYPEDHEYAGQLKHPEFAAAYTRAKQLQKHILVVNGLMGYYNGSFATFVATNFTDMEAKTKSEVSGPNGGPMEVRAALDMLDDVGEMAKRALNG